MRESRATRIQRIRDYIATSPLRKLPAKGRHDVYILRGDWTLYVAGVTPSNLAHIVPALERDQERVLLHDGSRTAVYMTPATSSIARATDSTLKGT
jgi:hypothetical protein